MTCDDGRNGAGAPADVPRALGLDVVRFAGALVHVVMAHGYSRGWDEAGYLNTIWAEGHRLGTRGVK